MCSYARQDKGFNDARQCEEVVEKLCEVQKNSYKHKTRNPQMSNAGLCMLPDCVKHVIGGDRWT
jgi:hypothetical protein